MENNFLIKASSIKTFTPILTFFDVTGYPHYENVVSNILKFFFSPIEEHGFGDLWLKALLNSYKTITNEELSIDNLYSIETIEREVYTENKKRIDILIPLNEVVIIIENKIYSGVNNPFEEYHNEIRKRYPNKRIIEILLSIKKEKNQEKGNINFINITYDDLIRDVEKIKNIDIEKNNKWVIFMQEFMKNVENIKGESEVNKDWQKFVDGNKEDFQQALSNYFRDIENKRNFLKNIKEEIGKLTEIKELEYNVYLPELQSKNEHFSVWINIQNSKKENIAIEAYIHKKMPSELILTLWNREQKQNASFSLEKELLSNRFCVEETSKSFWGKHLILKVYKFREDISANSIASEMLFIAEELKNKYNNI